MKYIIGTRNLPLILSSNGCGILKWCIDESFVVNPNMKEHTGDSLLIRRLFTIISSTKNKLNTQSSTKTYIVAVDYCMPAVLWTIYWLNYQGYGVFENIFYQYNEISFVMENNGKYSSRNFTKHINIRYYFVTDRIEKY